MAQAAKALEPPGDWKRATCAFVALSLFITSLNAFKPITVDDSVYYLFARHLSQYPLDPYGFSAWGIQQANTILAPPVLLYWWMLAVRFGGQEPWIWKLWLLPFSMLQVGVLYALGRRFARPLAMPFVCLVSLSPALLPCLNLMLDIPALALSLLAVLLFLRACEQRSLALTLLTALVAGIATQTKYTAFTACGVILLYGLVSGAWRRGLAVLTVTALLFLSWEVLIAWRYGDSHFLLGVRQNDAPAMAKVRLIQPLVGYLGGTMGLGIPLCLTALGRPARQVWLATGLVVSLLALVALLPTEDFAALGSVLHVSKWPVLSSVAFAVLGIFFIALTTLCVARLLHQPLTTAGTSAAMWLHSVDGFLFLWLMLEIAGYFALSPYAATRRIMGIVVLSLLLICRLTARNCPQRIGLVWGLAWVNLPIGLLAFAMDYNLYESQKVLAETLARECRNQAPGATIWYFGNGTFEFYGDRLGMKRIVPPLDVAVTSGDQVLVAEGFEEEFARHALRTRCVLVDTRRWTPILPLRSQYQYGNAAFTRLEGPLFRVTRYRVD